MRGGFVLALTSISLLSGCVGWETDEPPIVPIRNMYNQPRYDTQEKRPFFADGSSMRPEVEGTMSREMEPSLEIATGRTEDGSTWLSDVPAAVVSRSGGMPTLLERGRERYNIYCAPCHSEAGDGLGMVARRAEDLGAVALKPPTFHNDRLRQIPDGQLFATISNGVRNMPAYYFSIPVDDRWAIVAYVRALQLTQAPKPTAMNTTEQGQ